MLVGDRDRFRAARQRGYPAITITVTVNPSELGTLIRIITNSPSLTSLFTAVSLVQPLRILTVKSLELQFAIDSQSIPISNKVSDHFYGGRGSGLVLVRESLPPTRRSSTGKFLT